jgi:hypothetical protein
VAALGSRLIIGKNQSLRIGLLTFGSVLSHLVPDCFTVDQNQPFGIKLFWPFAGNDDILSVPVFQDVDRFSTKNGFLKV